MQFRKLFVFSFQISFFEARLNTIGHASTTQRTKHVLRNKISPNTAENSLVLIRAQRLLDSTTIKKTCLRLRSGRGKDYLQRRTQKYLSINCQYFVPATALGDVVKNTGGPPRLNQLAFA